MLIITRYSTSNTQYNQTLIHSCSLQRCNYSHLFMVLSSDKRRSAVYLLSARSYETEHLQPHTLQMHLYQQHWEVHGSSDTYAALLTFPGYCHTTIHVTLHVEWSLQHSFPWEQKTSTCTSSEVLCAAICVFPNFTIRFLQFSCCLRLLSRLPLTSTLPSVTCSEGSSYKMWPIKLAFLFSVLYVG